MDTARSTALPVKSSMGTALHSIPNKTERKSKEEILAIKVLYFLFQNYRCVLVTNRNRINNNTESRYSSVEEHLSSIYVNSGFVPSTTE